VYSFAEQPEAHSGLTGGAIAGIVCSVLIIVCAIVFGIFLFKKWKTQNGGGGILESDDTKTYSNP
jgi:hypothetical protein